MTFRLYIGWDPLDTVAFEVCAHSVLKHTSIPVEIKPLNQRVLRRMGLFTRPFHCTWDGQHVDGIDGKPCSTEFSFTRFLVPRLECFESEWVGFCDADMLFRSDIADLVEHTRDRPEALFCVQHNHAPTEKVKMGGLQQTVYDRKNWSSLMLMRPDRNRDLTMYRVNSASGSWLHGLRWLEDDQIGALPEAWNWLCGWSKGLDVKNVHFTRGTPDIPGYEDEPFADEWRAALKETGLNLAAFPLAV